LYKIFEAQAWIGLVVSFMAVGATDLPIHAVLVTVRKQL